jgi:hypothetical protein
VRAQGTSRHGDEHCGFEPLPFQIIQIGRLCIVVFKGCKKHSSKFKCCWYGLYHVQYYLPNNIVLLVNKDKFDPSLVLVNVNKLKLYFPYDNNTKGLVLEFKRAKKEGTVEAHEFLE